MEHPLYTFAELRFAEVICLRPGKVDSLFLISHFLDFETGKQPLFIIDYAEVNVSYSWQNTTENHKRNKAFQNHVQIRRHIWHIERAIIKVEAAGF